MGDFLLGALDFVSAVVLSVGLAAAVAYIVWARLRDSSGTVMDVRVVGGFTAVAGFLLAWAVLDFEQANILLALLIGVVAGALVWAISRQLSDASASSMLGSPTALALGAVYGALLLWAALDVERVGSTASAVFIAVTVSAGLFIGVNRLFDLAPTNWSAFLATVLGSMTLIVYAILWGNRVIEQPLLWTVVATVVAVATGYLLGSNEAPTTRLVIGAVGGGALGLFAGLNLREAITGSVSPEKFDSLVAAGILTEEGAQLATPIPQLEIGVAVLWLAIGVVVGLVMWQLRGRKTSPLRASAWWATAGWFIGALAAPTYGGLEKSDGIIATTVLGVLVGVSLALAPVRGERERRRVEQSSRKYIFLTPALFFIAASLLVPTVRTAWLSFLDRVGVENVGFANYAEVFTDANIINFSFVKTGWDVGGWTNIFTSLLFLWGLVIIGLGLIAAAITGQRRDKGLGASVSLGTGLLGSIVATATLAVFAIFQSSIIGQMIEDDVIVQTRRGLYIAIVVIAAAVLLSVVTLGSRRGESFEFSPGTISPIGFGMFVLAFAVFTAIRGTISNNLWWVFAVTIIATALGLAIAVLADRGKFENIAKSLIFMPMAISFVGAGIIWRFMYIARPVGREQTGVLNSLWVWMGQISNSGTGKTVAVLILAVFVVALGYLAYRGWRAEASGVMIGSIVMAIPFLWVIYKFIGPGFGGFTVLELADGTTRVDVSPVFFTSEGPFNNLWLMVVLIWIQTGFAMVIFSAAVKGVPQSLLEAAKVDGATESQSFWRVTIPQIAPTIGVVVTTLIVTVMKVFDIVRVMTAGNFDTNVIANEMYDKAFTEFNFGVGSALAIVLFLAILPIMFYNIRRMQKAAV